MTQSDFKNQVDNLMNILWGAGVASHATIIEQINYLVFLRSLSKKDDNAMILDSSAERIFNGELKKYHWDNLLILNADELFNSLEEVFRKLPELTSDQTIKLLFRDAHVKIFDKPTLRRLVHEIEKMFSDLEKQSTLGHTDIFGDMYEYLLSKLSQAGTLGSFRTPRHIIKFIVDIIDPKKSETILDPACGTAGFLVAALKHLEEKYTSEDFKKMDKYPMDLLSPQERDFVYKHTFTGFDSDFDMFKFGLMNLYLHKLEHPNIKRQNTLVDTAGDRTKWDVILANPPFSGALDKDSISEDIKMNTSSTEILFLRYIMDHLSSTGRSGVIIPDGILFGDTKAHIYLRRKLIEECNLRAVVSLPVGVFLPYADASTAILFFDKTKKTDCVYFYRIFNDGYSLDDKRSPIKENDLPKALKLIKNNSTNNNGILIDAKTIIDNKYSLVQGDYEQKNGHIKNIPNGWKTILLSDVIQEIKTVAGENNKFPVLSITKYDGFVESEKYFNKQVFSKNTSKYKVVKKGQFAYSPIHIDEGAVGFMNNFEFGIISPMYKVFELKNKSNKIIDPLFLLQVLKSEQLIALFKSSGKGSVKRRKAVSFERFKNIELHIPPINRQLEISQLVINIENEKKNLNNLKINLNKSIKTILEEVWGD